MKSDPVVIIAQLYEPNVNRVIEALDAKGVSWFRLNTETFPLLASASIHVSSDGDPFATFSFDGRTIDTRFARSVWFRRVSKWIMPSGLDEYSKRYAENECTSLLNGVFDLFRCPWINDRHFERIASNKIYQLHVASSLGFRIPKTLVTNDVEEMNMFIEDTSHPIIFKPIAGISAFGADFTNDLVSTYHDKFKHSPEITENFAENVPVVFARIFSDEMREYASSIEFSPVVFQEYINKKFEVRATIVGDRIFSAEIHSQDSEETTVDFRRFAIVSKDNIPPHFEHQLPIEIEERIYKIMNKLKLHFGCIDLILTPDGEYVFLEVNPSGQWQWIEAFTGLPITNSIISDLIYPHKIPLGYLNR